MQNRLYQKEPQMIFLDEKLLITINGAPSHKSTVFEIKFGT